MRTNERYIPRDNSEAGFLSEIASPSDPIEQERQEPEQRVVFNGGKIDLSVREI